MNENQGFDNWNEVKKKIHNKKESRRFFIKPRDIWFTKMGKNIGFEENGKRKFSRPVLVLKKVGNLFFTIALTTKGKENNKFYHKFKCVHFESSHVENVESSFAILSQAKVMDKKRFEEKIGYVEKKECNVIKQKITTLLL